MVRENAQKGGIEIILVILGTLIGMCGVFLHHDLSIKRTIRYAKFESLLFGMVGAVIGAFFYVSLGQCIGPFLEKETTSSEHTISAFVDANTTTGKAFLGTGYIDDELVYRYIMDAKEGKTIEEINTKEVYIHESDHTPHVVLTRYGDFKHGVLELILLNEEKGNIKRADFYVPEGTVTTDFSVDLE